MKKILQLTVFIVCICYNSAFAQFQMPIYHNGIPEVQSSVITIMSKIYPDFYLDKQNNNMLVFQGMRKNFWGTGYLRIMFTFSPNIDSQMTPYVTINMQAYSAIDSAFADTDYTPYNDASLDNILVYVSAVNDGYYYYGFQSKNTKITNVQPGSPAHKAGMAEGDVIIRWDTNSGTEEPANEIIMNRASIFKHLKYITSNGKIITMSGIYVTPQDALLEIMNS